MVLNLDIVPATQANERSRFVLIPLAMAAFGLALLQLEADDEAMEEDELQEDEEQLNMHCGVASLAAAILKCMLSPAPSIKRATLAQRTPACSFVGGRQRAPTSTSHCTVTPCHVATRLVRLFQKEGINKAAAKEQASLHACPSDIVVFAHNCFLDALY